MDDLVEIRAALIQLAKALEIERACVLRLVKYIENKTKQQMEQIENTSATAFSKIEV